MNTQQAGQFKQQNQPSRKGGEWKVTGGSCPSCGGNVSIRQVPCNCPRCTAYLTR